METATLVVVSLVLVLLAWAFFFRRRGNGDDPILPPPVEPPVFNPLGIEVAPVSYPNWWKHDDPDLINLLTEGGVMPEGMPTDLIAYWHASYGAKLYSITWQAYRIYPPSGSWSWVPGEHVLSGEYGEVARITGQGEGFVGGGCGQSSRAAMVGRYKVIALMRTSEGDFVVEKMLFVLPSRWWQ